MNKPANATEALRVCPREPTNAMLKAMLREIANVGGWINNDSLAAAWRAAYDESLTAQSIPQEPPHDDSELASDVAYLRAKNDPRLFDIANQLIYCWAQDGLLSKAQAERDKLRDELAETKRPLDDQMRRLNERVIELNDQNLRLRKIASHVPGRVYIEAKERAGHGVAVRPTNAIKSDGKE